MSIATELQRILDSKAALKTSIEAKGVTVGTIAIDEYAAKVDLIGGSGGGVKKTGQTTSYKTGDDGDLEIGTAIAFTDNSDGTITDNATGLMWAKDPAKIVPGGTGVVGASKGAWATSTAYSLRDLVSASLQTVNNPVWADGTTYTAGTFVKDLGTPGERWKCILNHTASDYQPGVASGWAGKWSNQTMAQWTSGGVYTDGQIVYDMGYVLECLANNTASRHDPDYDADWGDVWTLLAYYEDSHSYSTGDKVGMYGTVYFAKSNFTSNSSVDYPGMGSDWVTYWDVTSSMVQYWMSNTAYTAGDYIYSYDTYRVYYCKATHYSSNHEYNNSPDGETYWSNLGYMGWYPGTTYAVNDYAVNYVDNIYKLYKCTSAHTASTHEPRGMVMDYDTYWINCNLGYWNSSYSYVVGQCVTSYGYHEFICKSDHTSAYEDMPESGANWGTYWTLQPKAYVCISAHTSGSTTEPYWGASASTKWATTMWNTGDSLTSTDWFNWNLSIDMCNALVWNGFSDWRMPNVRELESLVNHESIAPCINGTYFPNTKYSTDYPIGYWTSTTDKYTTGNAKCIDFWNNGGFRNLQNYYGNTEYKVSPYNAQYCRPVRNI
jgi:hypothetical protein